MKKLMIAVVATIALPAAAFAQAAAAPLMAAPDAHATHEISGNCKDMMSGSHSGHQMSGAGGEVDHSKMDHSKVDHSKMAGCGDTAKAGVEAPAEPHANHKQ